MTTYLLSFDLGQEHASILLFFLGKGFSCFIHVVLVSIKETSEHKRSVPEISFILIQELTVTG